MNCPKCGESNSEHAKFCKSCGETLKKDKSNTIPAKKSMNKNKIMIIVLIVIVAILAVGVMYVGEYLKPIFLLKTWILKYLRWMCL